MNFLCQLRPWAVLLLLALAVDLRPALKAQPLPATESNSAAASEGGGEVLEEETITLNPFVVTANSDVGYVARETLAGSRMNTDLRDIASQVNVFTQEFMQDLALTDLASAMAYSLNTETDDQVLEVGAPGNAGLAATSRPFAATGGGGGGGGRTRGLVASNRTHDFFDTFTPIDAYNTERFTFSSGPNSILFGNGSPAGTIDTTFKRPLLSRPRYTVEFRVDDWGSDRETLDLNQPLKEGKLGLRVAALRERSKDWREPAFGKQDRIYTSLVFEPTEKISLLGYYEHATIHNQPIRNTLVQDHVTAWTSTGSIPYNNAAGGPLPGAGTTTPYVARPARPYYIVNDGGSRVPVALGTNTVTIRGYDTFSPAPNNFERSVVDESLYPYDLAYSGNATQTKIRSWIGGGMLDLSPVKNLHVQLAYNREEYRHRSADLLNNAAAELHVDPNQFLSDRVTPNPYFGRYFLENQVPINVKNHGEKDQRRLSASYDLDFTEKEGWMKWLGKHRLAVLLDRLDSFTIFQRSDYRVVGDYPFTSATATTRVINFRQYLEPGNMVLNLPFDPLADGIVTLPGSDVRIASWDPAGPTPSVPEANRSVSDSLMLATQSSFLDDRMVVFLGQREDEVDVQSATLPTNVPFQTMVKGDVPWVSAKVAKPVTRVKSVVVHPTPWLSAFYVKSDSEQVAALVRRNLDGSLALTGAGQGDEYGLSLNWGDRLTLRLSRYETASVGSPSSLRSPTSTAAAFGKGNNIRFDVPDLERTVQLAGAPASPGFTAFQEAIARVQPGDGWGTVGLFDVYDVLSDRVAKGYEALLMGNPTRNWRLSVTVSRNRTRESNVGQQYFEFIQERLPVWANYLDVPIHNETRLTMRSLLALTAQNWNFIRMSEGQLNQQERQYRVVGATRYTFTEGRLKNAFVGASYVWTSAAAVGYKTTTISDNPFLVPGVASSTITVSDLSQPLRGGSVGTWDGFVGYSRKFSRNRIDWRVQLNVRNLFDNDHLIMQKALTDGSGAIFSVPTPRTFILTNSFTF